MNDYITAKERLTFNIKDKWLIKIIFGAVFFTLTYIYLIQLTNDLGGV